MHAFEQWDESKLKPYPAGTLYSEPAKTPHYAWAKDPLRILKFPEQRPGSEKRLIEHR
jgi:hypothetical protein